MQQIPKLLVCSCSCIWASEWLTILLPTKVWLILEVLWYVKFLWSFLWNTVISGAIFCLQLRKTLSNEKRCYICSIFCLSLRSCPGINRNKDTYFATADYSNNFRSLGNLVNSYQVTIYFTSTWGVHFPDKCRLQDMYHTGHLGDKVKTLWNSLVIDHYSIKGWQEW